MARLRGKEVAGYTWTRSAGVDTYVSGNQGRGGSFLAVTRYQELPQDTHQITTCTVRGWYRAHAGAH